MLGEYSDGTPPGAAHFPDRNRIIAGLSAGVVFVEGSTRSGGRITARLALDANRAVFAVPGSVRNPMAAGPNELIRNNQAALVTDVAHICEELAPGLVWTQPSRSDAVARDLGTTNNRSSGCSTKSRSPRTCSESTYRWHRDGLRCRWPSSRSGGSRREGSRLRDLRTRGPDQENGGKPRLAWRPNGARRPRDQ
jgi:predicted Rossmann fold nucleotide-binding protein DprA/Smf involved in DNA uptake